ncbi:MAG: hypothetical protein KGI38_12390, partial [Thaumarchaeota archaeon]|nr:hypothetical protein [Nitrososphaerota archaeon]
INWRIFALANIPLVLFFAGWIEAGFPLSLDLKIGVTPLYNDPLTALIEFTYHLFTFVAVGAAFYAKLPQR